MIKQGLNPYVYIHISAQSRLSSY